MIVRLPDNSTAEFPDTMSDADIEAVIKKEYFSQPTNQVADSPIKSVDSNKIISGFSEEQEKNRATSQSILREIAPIAGATAATMLAGTAFPPAAAAGAGFASKLPWLVKPLQLMMRTGAAGLGGAAGSTLGQAIDGDVDYNTTLKDTALSMGGELALGGAIEPVASFIQKKAIKPLFELFPNLTFSGTAVKRAIYDKTKKTATERAKSFLLDVAPDVVKKQGDNFKDLSVMVNNAYAETGAIYDLYKNAIKEAADKEGGRLALDDTAQFIGDLYQSAEKKLGVEATKEEVLKEALGGFNYTANIKSQLSELLSDETADPKRIQYLMTNVFKNKGWNNLTPSQQEAREALKDAILSDLDRYTAGDLKKTADDQYKALMKFNAIKKIYNKSMTIVDKNTGEKALMPYTLYENIYAEKNRILKNKNIAELWPALEQEALAARDVSEKLTKTSVDVGPGSIFSRGIGGTAATYAFGPIGFPMAEAVGAATAWMLLSDAEKSALKRMLSSGVTERVGKEVLKFGARSTLRMGGNEIEFK